MLIAPMNPSCHTVVVLLLAALSLQSHVVAAPQQTVQPSPGTVPSVVAPKTTFQWIGAKGRVTHLQFAPHDDRLVVLFAPNGDKVKREIIILNVSDATAEYRFEALSPASVCFTPDGSRLVVLAADQLAIHDAGKREISVRIDRQSFDSKIQSLGFTADGEILVGAAEYLDPQTKRIAWSPKSGETVPVPGAAITWSGRGLSPDGSMFFSGGWPGPTPRIYKTDRTDRITYCFRSKLPIAASFTPDSKNLVTIHEDGLLVVWEIVPTGNENAKQLISQRGFDGCRNFAISSDRKQIATAENDGSVRIRRFPKSP